MSKQTPNAVTVGNNNSQMKHWWVKERSQNTRIQQFSLPADVHLYNLFQTTQWKVLGLDIVKPNQQELKEKPSKLLCTQEKAQQYTIAFIVVSDWLKGWCTFS